MIESQLTQLGQQVAQLQRTPNHFPSQPEASTSKGPHQINSLSNEVLVTLPQDKADEFEVSDEEVKEEFEIENPSKE